MHYDNLGSIDTITNSLGNIVGRFTYDPFGNKINFDKNGKIIEKSNITNRGFTGHETIEEADLVHMNGRVYDAKLGRFISPDPTIPHVHDTRSYNRYSYARNNPLKYIDPSGYTDFSLFDGIEDWDNENSWSHEDNSFDSFSESYSIDALMQEQIVHMYDPEEMHKGVWTQGMENALEFGGGFGRSSISYGSSRAWVKKSKSESKNSTKKKLKDGRKGKQKRLKEIMDDDKEASKFRGWIKQEVNQIKRGKRNNIRNPIGYDLAHKRGKEASKGYGYEHLNLLDKKLHKLQHKYDRYGRKR